MAYNFDFGRWYLTLRPGAGVTVFDGTRERPMVVDRIDVRGYIAVKEGRYDGRALFAFGPDGLALFDYHARVLPPEPAPREDERQLTAAQRKRLAAFMEALEDEGRET